jgi:hypothetical protein
MQAADPRRLDRARLHGVLCKQVVVRRGAGHATRAIVGRRLPGGHRRTPPPPAAAGLQRPPGACRCPSDPPRRRPFHRASCRRPRRFRLTRERAARRSATKLRLPPRATSSCRLGSRSIWPRRMTPLREKPQPALTPGTPCEPPRLRVRRRLQVGLFAGSQAVAVRDRPGGAWAGGMVAACCRSPSPCLTPAATAPRGSAGADFFRSTAPGSEKRKLPGGQLVA